MKSHETQFTLPDILRVVVGPPLVAAACAAMLHLGARAHLLPAPRPTLDADRAILLHQADAARQHPPVDIVLVGDSSCLMDVSAVQLSARLGRTVLNLGTLSYLDPEAYGRLLGEFTRRGAPQEIVLLMHPDALRRLGSENYHLTALTRYLAGVDDSRPGGPGTFNDWAGVDIFQGRLLARWVPTPLRGVYGAYYGFAPDLERYMTRQYGSAVDPGSEALAGTTEFRLSPSLEPASQAFRAAVPSTTRLWLGLTPTPAATAPPNFTNVRNGLLQAWAPWLGNVILLTNLPATLPATEFARATHLKPAAVPSYTEQLAAALSQKIPEGKPGPRP